MKSNQKLFRVMIVDDEFYFRKLLVNLIDWESLGYTVEAEAEDGAQALELAALKPFDLIIADINMPSMTGLQFAEALRASGIETRIIFITSYDIFEYARSAIQWGATHYLLKPVDEEELCRALREIHAELTQELESSDYIARLRQQVEQSKAHLKDQFIRQLVSFEPAVSPDVLHGQAQFYDIPVDTGAYAVIIAEIDEIHRAFSREEEKQLWRFAVKNVLQETLSAEGHYSAVIDGENHQIVVLCGFPEPNETVLFHLCRQARDYIEFRMKLRITLSIGQMYESLNQVHLSYSEGLYALKHKFTQGGNQVIAYAHNDINSEDAVFSHLIDRNEWLASIRKKDREAVGGHVQDICGKLVATHASKEIAVFVLMECISLGSTSILERGGSLPAGWMSDRHPLFKQMFVLETVSHLKQWLTQFFQDIVFHELSDPLPRNRCSEIVIKATEYVDEHYFDESITLQQTAREIAVNPSYLSHIFKKETGKSFTEYLTDVRLDKALDMLRIAAPGGADPIKIADVSQKVGYSDPYYFTKCFKKKFGYVPSRLVQPN